MPPFDRGLFHVKTIGENKIEADFLLVVYRIKQQQQQTMSSSSAFAQACSEIIAKEMFENFDIEYDCPKCGHNRGHHDVSKRNRLIPCESDGEGDEEEATVAEGDVIVDLTKLFYTADGLVENSGALDEFTKYFHDYDEAEDYFHKLVEDYPKGHEISMSWVDEIDEDGDVVYGDEIRCHHDP